MPRPARLQPQLLLLLVATGLSSALPLWPAELTSKEQDRVQALPGLTYDLGFAHYSGYLPASSGNFLHYW